MKTSIEQQNKKKEQARIAQNYITTVSGTITIERDCELITVRLNEPKLWNVTTQTLEPLSIDPDKFIVIGEDRQTTLNEFWFRFHTYLKARFHKFVNLEITYA